MGACVLVDPINIRYATDARNMQLFTMRNPARYVFIPLEGPVILFEHEGCHHLAEGLETIDEIRPAITVSFTAAGDRFDENARRWAGEVASLARRYADGSPIGLERVSHAAASALADKGYELVDAQMAVERARAIKSPDEIACIRASLAAVEEGVARLREAIRPDLTENEVWSRLHQAVIAQDGEYVETRLLSSGPHTNPWFQEASPRAIAAGELVALDTDVVGRYGYYSDFSRTFFCGSGRPTGEQRTLYGLAFEQVQTNIDLLRPGVTFRELSEKAWSIPDRYLDNRYFVLAHGCGMTGEYPYIAHAVDFDDIGYDGTIEENMTLCVESYIGASGGVEGVKLEEQVLVTASGTERLSRFPFDEALLGHEA
jgi:Xaa-Pro dipeptidase